MNYFKITMLACGASLILSSCAQIEKHWEKKQSAPVSVKTLTVEPQAGLSTKTYVGKVETAKSALVSSQCPGTLEQIFVSRGKAVRKGEAIARINSEAIQSAYDIAKATLNQAEDAYKRVTKIYEAGSVTDLKYVEVKTQLEKARAAEKSARKALEDCTVRAPFAGTVGDVFLSAGEKVSLAAPIIKLVDVGGLEIRFSVPENEYSSVTVGGTVAVEVPAAEKTVEGSVASKGVEASVLSHCYECTVKGLSESDGMMPGMVCKVRMNVATDTAMVVPAAAVMTDFEGRFVWTVDENSTVEKKYIVPGGYSGQGIVVTEGLLPGERVIVEGSRKVSTGMKVCAK